MISPAAQEHAIPDKLIREPPLDARLDEGPAPTERLHGSGATAVMLCDFDPIHFHTICRSRASLICTGRMQSGAAPAAFHPTLLRSAPLQRAQVACHRYRLIPPKLVGRGNAAGETNGCFGRTGDRTSVVMGKSG